VIQRGDLVRADVCFKVNGYSSDIQRTAYILKKDERQAPEFVQQIWVDALAANRAALGVIKPGATGKDVDTAGRSLLKEEVNVGLEEDIVITESGYEILGTPQTELWLVK
jgi:Xaa-Pro aminopeptidase